MSEPTHCTTTPVHVPDSVNDTRDVLVVEDDPEINLLVGAYAQLAGFVYRPAHDGTTGIDEAHRHAPAVIVLDLMLPDFDGFEVCRRLKSDPSLQRIPVIILTAMDNEICRLKGIECGASAYMTKPFDPDQLMEAIRRFSKRN